MAIYSDYGVPLKIFVREENNHVANHEKSHKKKYLPVESLTGESAREFYENIINETPTSKSESPVTRFKSAKRDKFIRVNGGKFNLHKLAQNNEFETLELALRDNNICVDSTDDFGWTPLMCAVCSRSVEAICVLLKYKADPHVCDKFGNNAFSLAKKKKFDLADMMKNVDYDRSVCKKESCEKLFCNTCQHEFYTDVKSHESSTVHLFNTRPKNPKTFYGIPDCNRGFQLLLKNGWNRERGLGPKECGMKFPVKVTMKNNRIGVGGESVKCKLDEMKNVGSHQMNRKRIINQERREKFFERHFRLQFS